MKLLSLDYIFAGFKLHWFRIC